MKVVLVRHGETEEDFCRKILGRKKVLMNDSGRRQVKQLRMKLDKKVFDVCYMSPLVRCVETAMILGGDKIELIPDARIIERDMGSLEGKNIQELNNYRFWDYDLNWNKFDIEPIQDVFERCRSFLNYILEKNYDSVLIVVDEAPYRALRYLLNNKKLKGKLYDNIINNCQYEEFDYK